MIGLEELTKCIKKLSADAVNTILLNYRPKNFSTPLPPSILLLIPTYDLLHLVVNTRDTTFTYKINALLGAQRKERPAHRQTLLFLSHYISFSAAY